MAMGIPKPREDHTPEIQAWLEKAKRQQREKRSLKKAIEEAGQDFALRGLRGPSTKTSTK